MNTFNKTLTMRRLECCRKSTRPAVTPDNFSDIKKAADRVYAEMGLDKLKGETCQ
ncbi:PerC family transcriptional regulator [Escherichia coli]|nr:PerC family transcriptional regulator [Escherichia coli]